MAGPHGRRRRSDPRYPACRGCSGPSLGRRHSAGHTESSCTPSMEPGRPRNRLQHRHSPTARRATTRSRCWRRSERPSRVVRLRRPTSSEEHDRDSDARHGGADRNPLGPAHECCRQDVRALQRVSDAHQKDDRADDEEDGAHEFWNFPAVDKTLPSALASNHGIARKPPGTHERRGAAQLRQRWTALWTSWMSSVFWHHRG